jgi:predicted O-methyltransferase YrrM
MFFGRLYRAVASPESFWRGVYARGYADRKRRPDEWLLFRQQMNRELAIRRPVTDGLPTVPVETLCPAVTGIDGSVSLLRPNPYNMSWEETVTLSVLLRALAPENLFEFGTFDGRTTLHLALNTPAAAVIHTLDIISGSFPFGADTPYFRHVTVGECYAGSRVRDKVRTLTGDSRTFDFSPYLGRMDFVLVDADHSYDGVLHDSKKAYDLLRHGGVVVWHDYLMIAETTRAILDLARDRPIKHLAGTTLAVWKDSGA